MSAKENNIDCSNDGEDEYELTLEEGIEDETLLESSASKKFTITSYGADYTVDGLVKRMRSGAFTIPDFQRRYVWSQRHASKFIESLLMGLPIPGIFLYKESDTNKHLVIDGQQRLRTLQNFYDRHFGERKFRLQNVNEVWNGKTYNDLDSSDQLKLDDSIVHATIFQQDEPRDVLDSIYFVFERINTGGVRLSPQEIRNCIAAGPFVALIKKLNLNNDWRSVFGGGINKRAKDEELIVRFLALYERGTTYKRPMVSFLNNFAKEMNRSGQDKLGDLELIFCKTIAIVNSSLNGRAFRPARSFNAAVFDAVMVGIARRLATGSSPEPRLIGEAYDRLLTDSEFKKGWERSTADEENVKIRLQAATEKFMAI